MCCFLRPAFKINALVLGNYATLDELCTLVEVSPRVEYVERAVDFYAKSGDEGTANLCGSRLIVPLTPFLGTTQVDRVFASIASNGALRTSNILGAILRSIRDSKRVSAEKFRELVASTGLNVSFRWLLVPDQESPEYEESEEQQEETPDARDQST